MRAPTPEAAALLALLGLAACLEAPPSGAGDGDDGGGADVDAGADAVDGATADADPGIALDVHCPSTNIAVTTIDGDDGDAAWDSAVVAIGFDPFSSNLESEVPDYQPDASLLFRCLHTGSTLYLFFDVTDGADPSSGAIITGGTDPTANDALALFFDGAGDLGGAYGGDDHWLLIDAAEGAVQSDAMVFTAATTADTDRQWRLEVAILLDAIAPGEERGEVLGFDLALHDEDGFPGGDPDMRSFFAAKKGADIAGCPPDGTPAPYCDTTQFATLALDP